MVMGIQPIKLAALSNSAHRNFHEKTILRLKTCSEEAKILIRRCLEGYCYAFGNENKTFEVAQRDPLIDALSDADRRRDLSFNTLNFRVESWYKINSPDFHNPAGILRQSLYEYIQRKRETDALDNMIRDWETLYIGCVRKLQLFPILARLKINNKDVKRISAQCKDETFFRSVINLKHARIATDKTYKSLVILVNTHLEVKDTEDLDEFSAFMNIHIAHYRQQTVV